ncbi:alpha-ketoglutarate-dependent dioxygenase AlkB family protein [Chryseobacterium sp. 5_R23647]|uniref:alpha-ketoglutarate-dependent dioxygenase AlkB family protein n=1 Tax=Chryseobacterium sp. 5_R23647 TaxID=2258964 RepID=UPI000E238938|nr:alpha-ketoglutarate-dependent dioxygenase AlkB [Chryseobacterium sp. 5_R23647]REC42017.1 alpha-ketoglutarate-dependent dioxygenase AlkB [Chryseobacterium sp. 5_R23647]
MRQLSLFEAEEYYEFPKEILEYRENFLDNEEANQLKDHLLKTAPWEQRTQKMYDKTVITPRLTAWYVDQNKSDESADSNTVKTNTWTPELLSLKERIEKEFGYRFNGVLLNLYRDKNDSVAWHRDKESRYGKRPVIASVSLGQTRNFDFRKKDHHQSKYSLPLPNGSLLIMKGDLQENWEHRIAKSTIPMKERINLTFRLINNQLSK